MAEEPDVIRQQIDETRESLADKLETLEGQVKGVVGTVSETIESVKTTVESTVGTVKSSLNETVDTVKETFDIPRQVERHPWGAVGCSFLAGLATGYLVTGRTFHRSHYPEAVRGMDQMASGYGGSPASERREFAAEPERAGFMSQLLGAFEGELDKIKGTAVGALMGLARDALKEVLPPSLSENVNEIIDNVTRRVGGEPVRGPVLQPDRFGERGEESRTATAY